MAENFVAGQGRIEIIGLTDNAVRNLRAVRGEVESLKRSGGPAGPSDSAGGGGDILGRFKVLRGLISRVFIPTIIARQVTAIVNYFDELRASSDQVKQSFAELGAQGAQALNSLVQRTDLTEFKRGLDGITEAVKEQRARIAELTEKESLRSRFPSALEKLGIIMGYIPSDDEIRAEAERQYGIVEQQAEIARRRYRGAQVDEIKKQAEAAAREMMTAEQRAAKDREDQEKRINELASQNLTDEQRAALEAARKVFDARMRYKKDEARESQRISLDELAKRLDMSPVIRAVNGTTAAVNGQRRGPHQPAVKD